MRAPKAIPQTGFQASGACQNTEVMEPAAGMEDALRLRGKHTSSSAHGEGQRKERGQGSQGEFGSASPRWQPHEDLAAHTQGAGQRPLADGQGLR